MQKPVLVAAAVAVAALSAGAVQAQGSFPSKPVRIIVGFDPGGPNDTQARFVGQKMGEAMGQTLLVENRPGADGIIGGDLVAKSTPDGHTMLLVSAGHSINTNFVKEVPYHPANDFSSIVQLSTAPFVLVVHPSVPAQTTAELIKYAKANPNKLHYGSTGLGSSLMMGMELFNLTAGIKTEHVPYKGGAPATQDLIAGRVQVMTNNVVGSLPNARAGKLRALGVTSAQRSPLAPDLPAVAETVPGYEMDAWYGLLGPKGIPAPVVSRLNAEANKVLQSAEVKQRFSTLGLTPVGGTPEAFMKHIQSELVKWAKVVKDSNMKVE
jgi:tripartite-type tricarboxylate transporter receptor subunit TctC